MDIISYILGVDGGYEYKNEYKQVWKWTSKTRAGEVGRGKLLPFNYKPNGFIDAERSL